MEAIGDEDERFAADLAEFGAAYGELARDDHRRFVDAFRNGAIPGWGRASRRARAIAKAEETPTTDPAMEGRRLYRDAASPRVFPLVRSCLHREYTFTIRRAPTS